MTKKKIYRAGVIPYIIIDGEIKMMFMKPSDVKYGGDVFQIAKGKTEEGETMKQAAFREASEELGLFSGNVLRSDEIGIFLGRMTMFIAEVKDIDMFGNPHFETSAVKWMTPEEFQNNGRDLHKPVVKAAVRKIKKLIGKQLAEEAANNTFPLNEVFDYRPDTIDWERNGNLLIGKFDIEGHTYGIFFEYGDIDNFTYVNVGFNAYDKNGREDRTLQHWKSNPYKVLGGVIKGFDEKIDDILKTQDVVVFGVVDKNEELEKRMKVYSYMVRRYAKQFGVIDQNVKGKNGRLQVLYNTNRINENQRNKIESIIKKINLK